MMLPLVQHLMQQHGEDVVEGSRERMVRDDDFVIDPEAVGRQAVVTERTDSLDRNRGRRDV